MYRRGTAVDVAALGLLTWYFMTPAAMLFAASLAMAMQRQPELLAALPCALFLGYLAEECAKQFARAIRGEPFDL